MNGMSHSLDDYIHLICLSTNREINQWQTRSKTISIWFLEIETHRHRYGYCIIKKHMSVTPRPPLAESVTPGSSLGFLDWPHRPTLVFSAHFVLTHAYLRSTSRSVTHPQIALGQAHLT
jgi:hypothetical protein